MRNKGMRNESIKKHLNIQKEYTGYRADAYMHPSFCFINEKHYNKKY